MEEPKKRNTLLVWLLLVACVVAFTLLNLDGDLPFREFRDFQRDVATGRVHEVRVVGNRIAVTLRGTGGKYETLGALGEDTMVSLSEQGVLVHFLKIRGAEGDAIVPKAQIQRIEALSGTETADPLDVVPDPWAGRLPGTA